MRLRWHIIILMLIILAGASASAVYFSLKVSVNVIENEISLSPSSFSINIAKGAHYVRSVKVYNSGGEAEVYFEEVIEGPDRNAIEVSFHTESGDSITTSKKLKLQPGTPDNPSVTVVNVHIDVKKDVPDGSYGIYIYAKR